jgi:DNA-binding MarR family transcriptional regulator
MQALTAPDLTAPDAADDGAGIALEDMAGSLGLLFKLAQLTAADRNRAHFGQMDMSPSAYTILRTIRGNPGLRQGHLAAALRIKPALMTRLIRDFEDAGWVARRIPDDDRRTVRLTLTPAGNARLARADTHAAAAFASEHQALTAAEIATLERLLRRYCGITQDGILHLPG